MLQVNGANLTFEPSVELYGEDSQTLDTVVNIGSNENQNYSLYHSLSSTVVVDNYLQQVKLILF